MNILWVDIETTGLIPEKDRILEICVIPEIDGKILKEDISNYIIKNIDISFESLLSEQILKMHTDSGLLSDIKNSLFNNTSIEITELDSLLENKYKLLKNNNSKVLLGGSSVHFDRSFLKKNLPKFDSLLHYQHIDVSCIENFFADSIGLLYKKNYTTKHRAKEDIGRSIEKYHFFKNFLIEKTKRNNFLFNIYYRILSYIKK